jgi:hypothetical protein
VSQTKSSRTALGVSELHIPGYAVSKLPFILSENDLVQETEISLPTMIHLNKCEFTSQDYDSLIPYQGGHLLHKTKRPIFTADECQQIVEEAEKRALEIRWTTNRHGNYPTTDLPIVELSETLKFLRVALVERIYPLLTAQFGEFLPDATKLRVADGFVVKYDAEGGQKELKPHR